MAAQQEFTDADVFGQSAAPQEEFSDADVFGAPKPKESFSEALERHPDLKEMIEEADPLEWAATRGVDALIRGTRRWAQKGSVQGMAAVRDYANQIATEEAALANYDREFGKVDAAKNPAGDRWRRDQVSKIALLRNEMGRYQTMAPELAQSFAAQQRKIDALPMTQAQEEFHREETPWWAFFKNPVELSVVTTAESLPSMVEGMVGAPGGPVAMAAGMGMSSHGAESAARVTEAMQKDGVDLTQPEQVLEWFADSANSDPKIAKARLAALGPATFDALTAGLAGRFLEPALGKGVRAVGAATAKEIGMQMAGGGVGSIAGSALAGERVDWKDVVLEMAAELAPGEAIGNVLREKSKPKPAAVELAEENFLPATAEVIEGFTEQPTKTGIDPDTGQPVQVVGGAPIPGAAPTAAQPDFLSVSPGSVQDWKERKTLRAAQLNQAEQILSSLESGATYDGENAQGVPIKIKVWEFDGKKIALVEGENGTVKLSATDLTWHNATEADGTEVWESGIKIFGKSTAPVPETAEAIAAQVALTRDPASSKAVTLITPGTEGISELPSDLESVETKHGLAIFNPAKTTREAVLAAAEGKDFDGTLLGMSQAAKPEPVGNTVVQTTKDSVPVLDEVVAPTPEAIAKATEAHKAAVPGGETTVRPAEEVIAERKGEAQATKPADAPTTTPKPAETTGTVPPERSDVAEPAGGPAVVPAEAAPKKFLRDFAPGEIVESESGRVQVLRHTKNSTFVSNTPNIASDPGYEISWSGDTKSWAPEKVKPTKHLKPEGVKSVTEEQWAEMRTLSPNQQAEKFGTTIARLLQANVVSQVNRETLARGTWPNGKKLTDADRARLQEENEQYTRELTEPVQQPKAPEAKPKTAKPKKAKPNLMEKAPPGGWRPEDKVPESMMRKPQASEWKPIGVNARGNPVFEDQRGVRSYTEGGIRVTESVGIIPGGGISINTAKRDKDYVPVEPTQKGAVDAKAESQTKPAGPQVPAVQTGPPAAGESKPGPGAEGERKASSGQGLKGLSENENARLEELKARLRKKLGQVGSGPDPEIITIGAEMAGLYVKAGTRRFIDFAGQVRRDLPDIWDSLKQHLKSIWEAAAVENPEIDEPSRAEVASVLAAIDNDIAAEQSALPDETRSELGEADTAGERTPVGGGAAPTTPADTGNRPDVGERVPEADEGAEGPRAAGGDRERVERPRADAGPEDTGRVQRGEAGGGTGADTAQPGERAGVSEPAHNNVGRQNYFLADPEAIVGGGPKARFSKNQEAIETYHTLIAEQRDPTTAEMDKLAAYTGWGSFGQELFNGSWERPQPKKGWEIEDAWLREQLGEEAWKSAQQSIINAHYTDPVTVTAMWEMVRRMGFTGGRVLEPGVGIGNFFSLMPRDLMANSTLTGIELDTMTARIAQMLHPQANIQNKGYQESKTADNFYDLVIGNWPFSDTKPADRRYNNLDANLHDYYFVKAMDQVRPGGIVIGITSAGTMDKKSPKIRRYLAARAELVASFRLPAGTFGKYAGTQVVTDVVILRKREKPVSDPKDAWIDSFEKVETRGDFKGSKYNLNAYYEKNPANIIGTIGVGRGSTYGRPGMVVVPPANHEEAIRTLPQRVPENVFQPWAQRRKELTGSIANTEAGARQLAIVERNGELYQVQGEQLVVADQLKKWRRKSAAQTKKRLQEAKDAIVIRTALDQLMDAYRKGDDTESPRQALKAAYQAFVARHGSVRDSFMLRYMENLQDGAAISVLNLEDDNGRPREVLERDVMRKKPAKVEAGSIDDAFAMQRNNSLHFSLKEVAELAQTTPEAVRERLVELGQIYQTPTGEWQARDEYLAGNVRRKMREAVAAQEQGIDMARNIEALKAVMPRDIPHFEIEVRMGANWVALDDYKDFVASLIPAKASEVKIDRMATGWKVKIDNETARRSNEATVLWGHEREWIDQILEAAMNGTQIRIYDETKEGQIFNEKATEEVNGKVEKIREQFQRWIWEDGGRTARLTAEYNEVANSLVTPQRDGSYLRLEGLALKMGTTEFDFRKHQRDAVARFTQDGKGMAAHEVGTGKTFTMAGLVMEGRRLGVFRKPIVFAHNANSASVRSDFQAAYPSGKFLYLDSLTPQERQARLRQIALDDWDAIIVPHSLINRFTLSETTMMELARDEIQALEDEIASVMADIGGKAYTKADLDDPKAFAKTVSFVPGAHTAKKLVKQRLRIIERIQKKAQEASKEDAVLFEELGIDAVLVDEAHIFKKISLATRKQIKGLSKDESGAGFALSLLADYTKKQQNGKGVYLFTGTPVTNTLNEVYNMMRYVMSSDMTEAGIQRFDDWFNMFADSESEVEMTEAGTYEAVDRLRAFINVSELARMAGRYFDVVFAKAMPEFKDRTSPDGMTENPVGRPFKKVTPVTVDMSPEQLAHMKTIRERFATWKKASGKARRQMMLDGKDTPLQLSTESSLAALDFRLVDRNAPDFPMSKVNVAVTKLLDIYRESPQTTQMVFMEQGYNDFTDREKVVRDEKGEPVTDADGNKKKVKERVEKFNLARDMVQKLINGGVKPEEIAIFANMKLNPAATVPNDPLRKVNRVTSAVTKEDLAKLMREGKIRIAFGQTATMGTGVNAQTLMRAMHHLDAPWQPGEFEQRNGRGWRQGNKWNTVLEHRYFAEGSGDGKRWQFLLNKVRFITRFMDALAGTGEGNLRTLEGEGADAAEANDTVADFEQSFGQAAGDPRQLLKAQLAKKIRKLEIKRDNHASGTYRAQRTIDEVQRSRPRREEAIANRERDTAAFNAMTAAPFEIEIEGKTYTERKEADEAFKRVPVHPQMTPIGHWGDFTILAWQQKIFLKGPSGIDYSASASMGSIASNLRHIQHYTDQLKEELKRDVESIPKLEEMARSPFTDQAKLDNTKLALATIEAEISISPFPAPSWLRNSVPMGSAIYLRQPGPSGMAPLKSVDVAAHRWDANNWWVLYEDEQGKMRPVPYTEVLDETGNPMFEPRKFELPPTMEAKPEAKPGEAPAEGDDDVSGGRAGAPLGPAAGAAALTPKSQRQIITDLAKGLKVPIRFGRLRTNKFAGYFQKVQNLIGSKRANDVPTVSHEVGHKLDETFGFSTDRAVRTELLALGDPSTPGSRSSWTPSKSTAYRLREGVAEFVRLWLTDPPQAKSQAPQMFTAFELAMDANKDVGDVMRTAQSDIDVWRRSEPQARLRSHISVGSNPNKTPYTFAQLTRDLVDDLHFLRLAVDDAEKAGTDLAPSENPYLLARTLRGSYGMADSFIRNGVADFTTKQVQLGTSLEDALKPVGGRLVDFRDWIVAKRAQELHARGRETGLVDSDVNATVARFENDAEFQEAFAKIKQWQDALLQYTVDAGLVTEEGAEKMREMNQDYVPLHRVFEVGAGEPSAVEGSGTGRGLNVGKPGSLKRLVGSTRDIIDPLETMVRNAYVMITAAEKAAINRAVADLSTRPNMGEWVEHIATPREAVTFGVEKVREQLDAAGADLTNVPDDLLLQFFQNSGHVPFKENVIRIVRNGKPEFYRLKRELFDTFHALDVEDAGALLRILSSPAQLLRGGVTLEPDFALRNALRDAVGSAIVSRYGMFPFEALVRGVRALARDPDLVANWMAAGGRNSIEATYFDREKLQKFLAERISKDLTPAERALVVLKSPVTALRLLTAFSEEATRIGEFEKTFQVLRRSGMPEGEARRLAAFESRDRQDFAKGGAKTKAVRRTVPFANAALQGNVRLYQAFKERPVATTLKGMAFITLPKLLEQAINWDDEDYWDRPQWERDLFFLIPLGKDEGGHTRFLRIPVPFLQGVIFATLPGRILQAYHDKNTEAVKDYPLLFARELVPMPVPPFLMTVLELRPEKGWDYYRGRQIVPESVAQLPSEMEWTAQTSLTARNVGGLLGVSPMKLDHAINSMTGGLGRRLTHQVVDRAISLATGEERTAQGTTPGGSFVTTPAAVSSQAITDFYRTLDDIRSAQAAQKKTGERQELARWSPRFSAAERRISVLRKRMRAAETEEAKDEAAEEILQVARRTMGAFREAQTNK